MSIKTQNSDITIILVCITLTHGSFHGIKMDYIFHVEMMISKVLTCEIDEEDNEFL